MLSQFSLKLEYKNSKTKNRLCTWKISDEPEVKT